MTQTITIAPLSRLEGHGKITIQLDDHGEVASSRFHVTEFRGFELFCRGRLLSEMPVITPRICGICPVSHHLAAAKATDDALGVEIPPAAKMLRELMHMGQTIHSHALHFFFLAAPDLVLGPDSDPALRNIVGLVAADPELAKKAIALRKIGQDIVARTGGRPIHPVTAIPGGMSKPLSPADRDAIRRDLPEALKLAQLAIEVARGVFEKQAALVPVFGAPQTKYMGLSRDGRLELYDGTLRLAAPDGTLLEEIDPRKYLDIIGEQVQPWSWLKFPYYLKQGYPEGTYRVGPLARLNLARTTGTPHADVELASFKQSGTGGMVHDTLRYHQARLIELLYAVERAFQLVEDDAIASTEVRVRVDRREGEGVGVIEAPRGTLIHHYWSDWAGKITKANFVVATIHNNTAIDASVNTVARNVVKGGKITEGALNQVEMAVRCYDPCLSCATHAVGRMPLELRLLAPDGTVLDTVRRES